MDLYYNNTDSSLLMDFTIDSDGVLSIVLYDSENNIIGSCEKTLASNSSYDLVYEFEGSYMNLDRNLSISRGQIKLITSNMATYGSRMRCDELPDIYGGQIIFQIDTRTFSGDTKELELILLRIQKDNINFSLPDEIEIETETNFEAEEIRVNGALRRRYWDTYSLEIDGTEYKFSEYGDDMSDSVVSVSMADREYVDCTVHKYTNGFGEALTRDVDNETIVIESLSGMVNTSRLQLSNGVGTFRWYNLGYTGDTRFKLGWRWYSGRADITVTVTE